MKLRVIFAASAVALLSSCVTSEIAPSTDNRPIPLDAILNQMKCEMALAFVKIDHSKLDLAGWYIDGKLTAKILTTDDGNASIGTPELLPLGSGVSGSFALGGGITVSRTLNQVSDIVISPYATNTTICDQPRAPGVRTVNGLGIYKWLHNLTATASGDPKIAFTNLGYTLDFGVKRTGNGGVDVSVIGIKTSAKATVTRDDTNQLVLNFTPGDAAIKEYKEVIRQQSNPGPYRTKNGVTFRPFSEKTDINLQGIFGNDTTLPDLEIKRVLPDSN